MSSELGTIRVCSAPGKVAAGRRRARLGVHVVVGRGVCSASHSALCPGPSVAFVSLHVFAFCKHGLGAYPVLGTNENKSVFLALWELKSHGKIT